jgi:hypothetical protein
VLSPREREGACRVCRALCPNGRHAAMGVHATVIAIAAAAH